MSKLHKIIGSAVVLSLLVFAVKMVPRTSAEDIDCKTLSGRSQSALEYCLTESRSKEEAYKTDYQTRSSEVATYRELLASGEADLRSLNSLAEGERVRQRVINRMLAGFTTAPQDQN